MTREDFDRFCRAIQWGWLASEAQKAGDTVSHKLAVRVSEDLYSSVEEVGMLEYCQGWFHWCYKHGTKGVA